MTRRLIAAACAAAAVLPFAAQAADGNVTLADYQAEARARLLQADADHDGKLTAAELANAPRPGSGQGGSPDGRGGGGRDPGRMFQMMDSNGDGFVDTAEIDAASLRRFQRMDANGDGKLTAQEREAGRGQWRGGGEGGDHGGDHGGMGGMGSMGGMDHGGQDHGGMGESGDDR